MQFSKFVVNFDLHWKSWLQETSEALFLNKYLHIFYSNSFEVFIILLGHFWPKITWTRNIIYVQMMKMRRRPRHCGNWDFFWGESRVLASLLEIRVLRGRGGDVFWREVGRFGCRRRGVGAAVSMTARLLQETLLEKWLLRILSSAGRPSCTQTSYVPNIFRSSRSTCRWVFNKIPLSPVWPNVWNFWEFLIQTITTKLT